MKLIRYISQKGREIRGILENDGQIRIVEGDFISGFKPTGSVAPEMDIKEYRIPVDPPNIIALGINYRRHALETNKEIPAEPLLFIKATNSLAPHGSAIVLPAVAPDEVDFEAELAVVIGKRARNLLPGQVKDYILGYTCANDVSARDCQFKRDRQWARAKSFDTFCPLGPVIETQLDPYNVRIECFLNGRCVQDSTTDDMIFGVYEAVSFISCSFTLLPGTVILTGTPCGVGVARKPPVFLKQGDKIEVQIEHIGILTNTVIANS